MLRRVRRVALLILVLLAAGMVAVVLTGRSTLEDGRDSVDNRWKPLVAPLATRYEQLDPAILAANDAGAGDRGPVVELVKALQTWSELRNQPHPSQDRFVSTANRIEGLAARFMALAHNSPRLQGNAAINDAFGKFAVAKPRPQLVTAYNDSVRRYEKNRTSFPRDLAARLLGFHARTALALTE